MFGERLRNILEDREIPQTKLAQELGYTQQAVNRWCNNTTEPDNKTLVIIAKYLNVSTDYLLGNDKRTNMDYDYEVLKKILIKYKYLNENKKLTKKEIINIMKFIIINKEYLKEK